jgi:hypothetical protein
LVPLDQILGRVDILGLMMISQKPQAHYCFDKFFQDMKGWLLAKFLMNSLLNYGYSHWIVLRVKQVLITTLQRLLSIYFSYKGAN